MKKITILISAFIIFSLASFGQTTSSKQDTSKPKQYLVYMTMNQWQDMVTILDACHGDHTVIESLKNTIIGYLQYQVKSEMDTTKKQPTK